MTEASPAVAHLFRQEFYGARAEYPDVPADLIRSAGRPTKAEPRGEDELWWLAHGPQMVQRWLDWRDQSGWSVWTAPDGRPGIELELYPEFDGVRVRMFIDRVMVVPVSGSEVIVDLKSGKRSPASDLQLGFYRTGLLQAFGVDVKWGAYWNARTGELAPVQNLSRFTPGVMSHWLDRFVAARESRIFLPHLTERCRACGVNQFCYAFGGERSGTDPDSVYAARVVPRG